MWILTFISCFEAMTMQFISHRFPEDHDPTIGRSDSHLEFQINPITVFLVSVFEMVFDFLHFEPFFGV